MIPGAAPLSSFFSSVDEGHLHSDLRAVGVPIDGHLAPLHRILVVGVPWLGEMELDAVFFEYLNGGSVVPCCIDSMVFLMETSEGDSLGGCFGLELVPFLGLA